MAQEYPRAHEFYLQLQDLQPQLPHYHSQYDLSHHHATPSYGELTASDGGGQAEAQAPPAAMLAAHPPPVPQPAIAHNHHHDPRKKKGTHMLTATFDDLDLSATMSSNRYEMVPDNTQRKRKTYSHNSERFEMASPNIHRKRRSSSVYGNSSAYDDDGDGDSRSSSMASDKKQNHSEIEKRRRDKMNTYISELSAMIPMCGAMARKLDKLTVLRMAVQHLRSIRGTLSACPLTASPRPAYLTERELNSLLLQSAKDCFVLVVGCDRGRLLYVSASVTQMLHYESSELLGQSLFDILHPKDVAKVKEQLSSSDLSPRERLIDIKTMMPVKADMMAGASRFGPGARRSFFCRIKCKVAPGNMETSSVPIKEEVDTSGKTRKKQSNEKKYCVVQFTGYLKSWNASELSPEGNIGTPEGGEDGETVSMSCLVAVGRALPDLTPSVYTAGSVVPPTRPLQYVSRHATDGKFLFVDQRVTLALGFLPQELLGTSLYEYVSGPELSGVARTHKQALLRRESLHTPPYSVRKKDNTLARIQTHFKPFRNPWTKDIECLVANNTVINDAQAGLYEDHSQSTYDLYKQLDSGVHGAFPALALYSDQRDISEVSEADAEMQRLIDSQVESHKVGSAIVEEVLRSSSSELSPDLSADLLQEGVLNEQATLADILCADMNGFNQVRNNVPLSAASGESPPSVQSSTMMADLSPPLGSPPLPHLGIDGNGEAAMAVIMTLLEADAGLGGPVNFSGLPWPLP